MLSDRPTHYSGIRCLHWPCRTCHACPTGLQRGAYVGIFDRMLPDMRRLPSRVCLALIGGLVIAACAPTVHNEWHRVDGRPPEPMALEQALRECRGQGATAAANSPQLFYQRNQTLDAVMGGCMNQRGYASVQVPNR